MKLRLYPKLAFLGIQKNKRLYIPYILTCSGMIMMYYIISFLIETPILDYMRGRSTIAMTLTLGCYVMGIFAVLFLFYTHSFLIRRRKKEFGLYNILGMGKKNIGFVLFWESVMVTGISLFIGLLAGITCSKLAELGLVNTLHAEVVYTLSLSTASIRNTILLFSCISALIFFHTLWQIHLTNPVELLHSENSGEKPPKGNWLFGIASILLLGFAYYIAVSIQSPIEALLWFFVAVVMVIIGTYLLFISGSVLLCRSLQKNKNYYYKARHFISTSSMTWRMKRNGAGLASICILGTMVLVMITGSACLYFGTEDSLHARYPYDFNNRIGFQTLTEYSDSYISEMKDGISKLLEDSGTVAENLSDYRMATLTGFLKEDTVLIDNNTVESAYQNSEPYDSLRQVCFVPLSDYNKLTGTETLLAKGEILLCPVLCDYAYSSFTVSGLGNFRIAGTAENFFKDEVWTENVMPSLIVILPDFIETLQPLAAPKDNDENPLVHYSWYYNFNTSLSSSAQIELYGQLRDVLYNKHGIDSKDTVRFSSCNSLAANREDFYSSYGSLFFLGIMLSTVFLFATVLIIYYKQISEGYEDQTRFEIMQNVGMTKTEIRQSINSQMRTVFFLPLVTAVLHLAFAFPMIQKLLMIFQIDHPKLLLVIAAVSVLIFAIFYTLIYRITSNAYYSIVSGAKENE